MLRKDDIEYIASCAEIVVDKMASVHGGCLYHSSMLAAMINDNTDMRASLVVGSLEIDETTIFSHFPIKPILDSGNDLLIEWDGHAWVSISDMICDLSLFQTIYSGQTPDKVMNIINKKFGEPKPYLIGQDSKLNTMNIIYSKKEILGDKYITLFIQNAARIGLIDI